MHCSWRRSPLSKKLVAVLSLVIVAWGTGPGAGLGFGGATAHAAEVELRFDRAPVHEVLQVLAEAEGINLIVDHGVDGEVSMSARGLSMREAIELVAALRGLYLEEIGTTLVVSTEPKGLAGKLGQTESSLAFTQRPVGEVLQALASRAGWNLIAEARLDREVTAWIDGMEDVEALRHVAKAAGLSYRLVDRVLYVKEPEPAEDEKVQIAIHRLDHAAPERAGELVRAFVPGVRVEVDEVTRSVVVSGTGRDLAKVADLIGSFDTAKPQVLVEARILEVAVDALESLGIEWSQLITFAGAGTPAAFEMTWNPAQLEATLRSLVERGRSKVLASPKISAVDDESARMLIGDRVPIVTEHTDSEGRVTQTVEYLDVGIVLEIEPRIASDGSVTLDIRTEVSSVADPTSRFPTVRTREATTRVRVQDGRPLIIGGLIQEEERERMSGIPYLNQLPVVGSLFGRRETENVQTETLIILIPHIVNDGAPSNGAGAFGLAEAGTVEARRESAMDGQTVTTDGPSVALDRQNAPSGETPGETTPSQVEVLEARALSRLQWAKEPSDKPLTVSLELLTLADRATELQFERESARTSWISRLYAGFDDDGRAAWSVAGAFRLYAGDEGPPPYMRPWIDGGMEYAVPVDDDPVWVLTAGAGLKLSIGDEGMVEFYARHQETTRELAPAGLPGRSVPNLLGVKLGWRY